jgi:dipeptidyl aminopeptidase/acylaminoacyl peptidase
MWKEPTLSNNLTPLLGGHPREKMELCCHASPSNYSPRTAAPLLLIHGENDPVVPARQAHALAERLNRGGGKASVVVLAGQGHTWQGEALVESIDRTLTFFDETLKK